MTDSDFQKIENQLEIKLPDFYKNTMLNYPFSGSSYANEFSLPNNPVIVIDLNTLFFDATDNKLVIGSDGGGWFFYLELDKGEEVYTFDLEESPIHMKPCAHSWVGYLKKLEEEEIEYEKDCPLIFDSKKWWQFWK